MPAPINKISPHKKFYSDGVAGEGGQEDGSTGLKVLADKFDHPPPPPPRKKKKVCFWKPYHHNNSVFGLDLQSVSVVGCYKAEHFLTILSLTFVELSISLAQTFTVFTRTSLKTYTYHIILSWRSPKRFIKNHCHLPVATL